MLGETARRAGALMPRVLPVVLVCAACPLSQASSARALPTWLPPTNVGETGIEGRPDVAVDATGDATAVWERPDGGGYEIQAAERSAGGAWQAPVRLFSTSNEGTGAPHIAVDSQGAAVAVWKSGGPEHFVVDAASRSTASGVWSSPIELGAAGAANPEPRIALDTLGNAVAVWTGEGPHPGTQHIFAATMPTGGAWSVPIVISQGNSAGPPRLVVDARGDFTAIWGGFNVIESSVKPAGRGWEVPSVLSEQWTGSPAVGINAYGEAVAAWILAISNTERRIQGAVRTADGLWGEPVDLSEVTEEVGQPEVAIDAHGDAAAIWSTAGGTSANPGIFATVRSSGGAWQTPTELSKTKPPVSNPQVALNSKREVLALWWGVDAGNTVVESAARSAESGGWQSPVALSGTASYTAMPRLSLDGQGNAVAVWQAAGSSGEGVIQVAGHETAGPQLRELSIPSSAFVNQPISFSVSPLDAWSALGDTNWSFGDGTSASGISVIHSYSEPGVYEATVTSANVLGNTTSTSALITVSEEHEPPSAPHEQQAAPIISGTRQSHRRWREHSGTSAHHHARLPLGTDFTFSLNEQARVTFAFTRVVKGRSVGHRCVPRGIRNRRRAHCRWRVAAGTMSLTAHAGVNTVPFRGRVSGSRRLRPGRYTLVLTATNTAGVSRSRRLTFVIV